MPAVTPLQTMQGHTDRIQGVVHLPGGRRIITCSLDGSLRLWDLESGAQIGEDWRDEENKKEGVYSMALSPNGKNVFSGTHDGKVKLWDVEMGKVVATWTGHTKGVLSVCWSVDGNQVVSGSWDGTARVRDVKTGEEILEIKTGHQDVWAVIYSPDNKQIATGGYYGGYKDGIKIWNTPIMIGTRGFKLYDLKDKVKIWDAKTGELIVILKHDYMVGSLAWTSDGKRLISASFGPIRIFDTATWQQVGTLEGHAWVHAISLSGNNRFLVSTSDDKTARLWNLDTNLPIGPSFQHEDCVECAAFSADGKVLVTGCRNKNTYMWNIHAILKQAGLEDLLTTDTNITKIIPVQKASQDGPRRERTPRSSLSSNSFLEADATRRHDEYGGFDELPPRFFDGMEADDGSSPTGNAHPHSSASALLARLASLFHRFRLGPDNAEADELPQPPTLPALHPRVLFTRLSSLIRRNSPPDDTPNEELQQPSTPLRLDLHVLLTRLSLLLPRSRLNTDGETEAHHTTPSGSRPDAIVDRLSSIFRSRPHTNENVELSQRATRLHVVDVAPMRDREVLFVAPRVQEDRPHHQSAGTATPGARPPHSRPIRLLGHIGLYLCCVCNHQHVDGSAQSTQQPQDQSQGQMQAHATLRKQQQESHSQGQVQAQASSSQIQPAAPSTSAIPTALDTHITAPGASA